MMGAIVVVRTCTVLEPDRQLPRWFTISPIGAFLALLVMGLLRMARQSVRLSTGRVRDHVCASATVFDAVWPGEALMVGEQTSWFGQEITSEQPIPQ